MFELGTPRVDFRGLTPSSACSGDLRASGSKQEHRRGEGLLFDLDANEFDICEFFFNCFFMSP